MRHRVNVAPPAASVRVPMAIPVIARIARLIKVITVPFFERRRHRLVNDPAMV